ncbi:MAG: small ribosomal subunit Rsm22 family protein [Opitutaceae bacterium]|jgi:hypothetical protein|nr:small ribosomal subunit Rsm22 family protein [Opitutaceae bacterium]
MNYPEPGSAPPPLPPRLDWEALDRLRARFLSGAATATATATTAATTTNAPYWKTERALESYDATYGERIGWKWDAVLHELRVRHWRPPAGGVLLDWGCGSGIAGRRVLAAFGPDTFADMRLWDHSPLARRFALDRAREQFPGKAAIGEWNGEWDGAAGIPLVLVVSHVINELSPAGRTALLTLAGRAAAVIWVEPGTHADSRALAAVRDELLKTAASANAANTANTANASSNPAPRLIAPCTHCEACPLFRAENERHWCHFFATPPAGVQNDPEWVHFGQRAGIDLRSLPYSFLVLDRPAMSPAAASGKGGGGGEGGKAEAAGTIAADVVGAARVPGRPGIFKGYARMLSCEATGLVELELQKRADPQLLRELSRRPGIPLYRWEHDGRRITRAERIRERRPPCRCDEL